MKTLPLIQQKAREEFREHERIAGRPVFDDQLYFLDLQIAEIVSSTLAEVEKMVPEEKEFPILGAYSADHAIQEERHFGWNDLRTSFLEKLNKLKEGV